MIVDDLSHGRKANIPAAAKFQHLDVRSPESALLVREGRFDCLYMLAAQMDVRISVADPVADASQNIIGALNLLEAARHAPHRPRVIFSSTGGAIYGDASPPPSAEDSEKNPESPYGISKLSVEFYLAYYMRTHGLDTVALRYSNVYGPRQDPHGEAGVVAIFGNALLQGRPAVIYGDGSSIRDYVFVEDVADAFARAVGDKGDGRRFNIGTGVGTSVRALHAALADAALAPDDPVFAPARLGELQAITLDVAAAGAELGWVPRTDLQEGLLKTLHWIQTQPDRPPAK